VAFAGDAGKASAWRTSPHSRARSAIHSSAISASAGSGQPPPTSLRTPANHTCSTCWSARGSLVHGVGPNELRSSSMARAWNAASTQLLNCVSWNCHQRLTRLTACGPLIGMPRARPCPRRG
jgi:hypothetical protein